MLHVTLSIPMFLSRPCLSLLFSCYFFLNYWIKSWNRYSYCIISIICMCSFSFCEVINGTCAQCTCTCAKFALEIFKLSSRPKCYNLTNSQTRSQYSIELRNTKISRVPYLGRVLVNKNLAVVKLWSKLIWLTVYYWWIFSSNFITEPRTDEIFDCSCRATQ